MGCVASISIFFHSSSFIWSFSDKLGKVGIPEAVLLLLGDVVVAFVVVVVVVVVDLF